MRWLLRWRFGRRLRLGLHRLGAGELPLIQVICGNPRQQFAMSLLRVSSWGSARPRILFENLFFTGVQTLDALLADFF